MPTHAKVGQTEILIEKGDLAAAAVEAVVSPEATDLEMSVGVAKVLALQGGPLVPQQARAKAPIPLGTVTITTAGQLPFKHILHAAIVEAKGDKETHRDTISSIVTKTLEACMTLGLSSVAFPMLGMPSAKVPYDTFARVMLSSAIEFLQQQTPEDLRKIVFVLFNKDAFSSFQQQLDIAKQTYFLI